MRHPNRDRARKLRREQTDAEGKLWYLLRNRRLAGYKFKRQFPIGRYIADFACAELKLVIEADGGQHADRQPYDDNRSRWLQCEGWRVLRFWNHDILNNIEGVTETLLEAVRFLENNPSPYPLPASGERENR
ncbi:endonuclease domain-containing protein [Hyphobacterium indicum]|uniref:endonuclease domain-containing protein n=1 Tax=Hyphobacterium indicum TaxID=2162714 RepID=UPI000D653616|nr:endonuclease domain-containing protein [Hyphobacterium indicum]